MQNIFFLPQKCVVRALIFKNDVLKPENLKRFTFFVFYVFGQLLPREAEHMKLRLHIILNYYTNYRSVVQCPVVLARSCGEKCVSFITGADEDDSQLHQLK